MPSEPVKFLLPFAVPAKDRQKRFTEKMEKAAILCLAELERQKSEGLILKRQTEETVFIAEAHYPVWLAPWRKKTLFFDGLGIKTHTFSNARLPDVKTFVSNIEGASRNHEAYLAFLSNNLKYFEHSAEEERKTIKGLITSPDFIEDFTPYLSLAKKIRKTIPAKIFLSPTLDESEISSSAREISDLREGLTQDIVDLHDAMRLLSHTAKRYEKDFQKEIGSVRKKFDEEIAGLNPLVMKKIREIQKEFDKKISLVSEDVERQLHLLHQEYIKLEKTKQRKVANIDRCEAEIKSSRLRKDETAELRWKRDIESCREEISALDEKLRNLQNSIKDTESVKKTETTKIREECDIETDKIMEDIREVEASRDAKIRMIQKELTSIQDLTSQIIEQINKSIELKRQAISNFDQVGVKKRRRTYVLAYVPFYLTCYQTRSKRRYAVYPPSIAGSMGILTKFKGVFGVAKAKSLLQFRSEPMTDLIDQIVMLLDNNPVFEKEMHDAGIDSNILQTEKLRKRLRKGLGELRDEEWISENEFEVFTKPLTRAKLEQ